MSELEVDMADLTLGDLIDVADLLGCSLSDALQGPQQPKAMAALAWVTVRRTDPDFTFDQAKTLKLADLKIVGTPDEPDPKAPAGNNGGPLAVLPASGA